ADAPASRESFGGQRLALATITLDARPFAVIAGASCCHCERKRSNLARALGRNPRERLLRCARNDSKGLMGANRRDHDIPRLPRAVAFDPTGGFDSGPARLIQAKQARKILTQIAQKTDL